MPTRTAAEVKTPMGKMDADPSSVDDDRLEPGSMSEAIREGIKRVGDPEAAASKVKEAVIEMFPAMKERVESETNWNSYVTQNRDKAAAEMGVQRRKRLAASDADVRARGENVVCLADYDAGREVVDEIFGGDGEKAEQLLALLEQLNVVELQRAVTAWLRLVKSAGSAETAQKVLDAMKENATGE